ncbi:pyridoxamine 5'-phosphate oxidase family protein [Methylobacterium sp. J-048]|uniref:pyridoxamine 5'-phosphate oxidase family protein n=1 Tax=Methylobacterium sp. J-048 TaxID=2836635 RepID=UPI001FBBE752|nr:pyridoxamine 5'-phosphate oxidase family protein [Methylobacterium sp. J-048]MCJ2055003.1 pyridoxamine 5'-phosphate oxidase family protein [Methylobacterium sp. J-048]
MMAVGSPVRPCRSAAACGFSGDPKGLTMLTQDMKDTVHKQRLGFVATVSETGEPNLSPKGTFVVVDDRTLAFGAIRSPGTITNLHHRPGIEVNFVDPIRRKGFRARGTATVHARDTDVYRLHRARFDGWGSLADRIGHIVLIDIFDAAPLTSPAYDDGAKEADLQAHWSAILMSDDFGSTAMTNPATMV